MDDNLNYQKCDTCGHSEYVVVMKEWADDEGFYCCRLFCKNCRNEWNYHEALDIHYQEYDEDYDYDE